MNINSLSFYGKAAVSRNRIQNTIMPRTDTAASVAVQKEGITFSPSRNYIANKYRGSERDLAMKYFKAASDKDISPFEEAESLKNLKGFADAAQNSDKSFISALADKYAELYKDIETGSYAGEDERKQAYEILDKTFDFMVGELSGELGDGAEERLNAASSYLYQNGTEKQVEKIKGFSEFQKVFDKSAFKDYMKSLADSIKSYVKEGGEAPSEDFIDRAAKDRGGKFEHMSDKELKFLRGYISGEEELEGYEELSERFKYTLRKSEIQFDLAKSVDEDLKLMNERKERAEKKQNILEGFLESYLAEKSSPFSEESHKSIKASVNKLIKDAGFESGEAAAFLQMADSFGLNGAEEAHRKFLYTNIGEAKASIKAIDRADKSEVFYSGKSRHNKSLLENIEEKLKEI